MDHEDRSFFSRFFIPSYDELALFLMSITFVLLYCVDAAMRQDLHKFVFNEFDFRMTLVIMIFIAGLAFSIYHVFTDRVKKIYEKWIMLFFAVTINAASGIYAGIHLFKHAKGWLLIFPALNIINGGALIVMLRFGIIDDECIADEDTTILQVIFSFLVLGIIFLLCQFHFDLYWAITFSICVAYVTNINDVLKVPMALKAPSEDFHDQFKDAYDQAMVNKATSRYRNVNSESPDMTYTKSTKKARRTFLIACRLAIEDGKLDLDEKRELTDLAKSLKIEKDLARQLFKEEKNCSISARINMVHTIRIDFRNDLYFAPMLLWESSSFLFSYRISCP